MTTSFSSWKLRFFVGTLLRLFKIYCKFRVSGLENLPLHGPGILVANHRSYLDIPAIASVLGQQGSLEETGWVTGKSTYRDPFIHFLFSDAPLIVVNGTVKKAEAALKAGQFIVIFPEGYYAWRKFLYDRGKEKTEPARCLGTSAAILGLKTGCPIIPMGIRGTYEAMPPFSLFPKRGDLSLRIGEPFRFEVPEPEAVTDAMISEKTDFIMKQIDALC